MSAISEFLAAKDIWRDPLLASVIAGGLCGFLGVYVVLRRTVFVSAALTQLSTLGLICALLAEESLHIEAEHAGVQLAVAILFSVAGALVLGALQVRRRLPAEAGVGIAYVVAGALVVLGANRLVHAAHDLNSMVFGNAVAVPFSDVLVLGAVALVCAAVHTAFAKELVFTSFDGETAAALGYSTRTWNGLLYFTIGLAIPAAARALGALPVFAFLTIPASAALLFSTRLRTAFAVATLLGVLAAAGGYALSWIWQLPTGATMVALAGLFVIPGAIAKGARG
ncbi:MAG TPA: metal ABC transporter permease [Anaeromyxobacteraceae bacterium]|jgi:zinc transport system permease protein|nr:metal ABC transporter permease [Anaeromyxobacteraceae bacterium]